VQQEKKSVYRAVRVRLRVLPAQEQRVGERRRGGNDCGNDRFSHLPVVYYSMKTMAKGRKQRLP
jgi:hypothetical protein